uniref:Lipid scramblase CLPTM1L n=1 Tax=Felis catus TaxID=9685 RepID=A0ABI7VQ81_FELCA
MWSGRSSFTSLVVGVFVVYVVHTCWVMYGIVYTRPCGSDGNCIQPYLARRPKLQLSVYTTTRSNLGAENNVDLVLNVEDFDVESKFERTVNVSVPKKTRNNGTLYAYIFLHHAGILPWHDGKQVHLVSPLTTYMVPRPEEVNLLTGESTTQQIEAEKKPPSALDEPVSHWRPRLTLNVMVDDFVFDGASLPADVHRYMKMIQLGKTVHYLPILFIDQLSNRVKDLMVINRSSTELPLTVSYDKISLGRLRFWIHMQDAVYSLQQFGFSEKDADEVKGIFVDTNLYFLALTFFVAAFHLLFDFLAFKNDISFWKKKRSMIGMSTKAVLWRGFSTVVIFLFLLDEQTSLLVLVPAGIGAAIELWKVKKALKMSVVWRGLRPQFQFGTYSESERKTEEYDTQAMRYLSYLLYPLCIGGAVYSLLNVKYKSWYSWLINSFVNGELWGFGSASSARGCSSWFPHVARVVRGRAGRTSATSHPCSLWRGPPDTWFVCGGPAQAARENGLGQAGSNAVRRAVSEGGYGACEPCAWAGSASSEGTDPGPDGPGFLAGTRRALAGPSRLRGTR